jgi:tetratricopeptide (TPR) repeat protein
MASLGYYYLNLGLAEEGLRLSEESVEIAEELGSPLYVMKARTILGASYLHSGRWQEAVEELESVFESACDMGFTPDAVIILHQLTRAYLDTTQFEKAERSLEQMLELANASEMREFIARGLWLQSQLELQKERHDAALEALVLAPTVAQEIDSRTSQYLIQIEKAHIYQAAANDPASRDAMIYAQRLQKKLVDNLRDDTIRQAFLSNTNAVRLQNVVERHMKKATA